MQPFFDVMLLCSALHWHRRPPQPLPLVYLPLLHPPLLHPPVLHLPLLHLLQLHIPVLDSLHSYLCRLTLSKVLKR